MKTTRHDVLTCPVCGGKLDASSSLYDETAVPKPGDITICIECETVLHYENGLKLAVEDDPAVLEHPDVATAVWTLRAIKHVGKGKNS